MEIIIDYNRYHDYICGFIDPYEIPAAETAIDKAERGKIVRCKECVNRLSFDDQTIPPGCSIWGRFTTDDTFCSYGERSADDE